ncbi:MAG: hypothetical protein ACYTEU_12195 [Planctomycetota bacterium]|jgi:hypothetical protein
MESKTMEIDKDDVVRLHEKIDDLGKDMTVMKVDMAEVKTKLSLTPEIKQPCSYLIDHKQEHKDNMTLWKRPIASGIIGAMFVTLGLFLRPAWEWVKTKI